ncbi:HflK protein [Rodentibacter pneumotropicus]|uniref:HflK protein n=1 Tax=Rodentibacter pneumotropicus TaxID=758 RepID=A0A3S4XVJ2_9PAST|nr:HflK protein [Rodentibacter pneumotropicus]
MSQNSGQDPWGKPGQSNEQKPENSSNNGWDSNQNRGNQEQSPPDIEEMFNNLLKKLGGGGKRAVKIMAVLTIRLQLHLTGVKHCRLPLL